MLGRIPFRTDDPAAAVARGDRKPGHSASSTDQLNVNGEGGLRPDAAQAGLSPWDHAPAITSPLQVIPARIGALFEGSVRSGGSLN
jgi:hypothetical protein